MNQLHPRQDDSGELASTRSAITRQDLLGKETGRPARLSVNGRAIAPVYPEGSHMTTRSTGLGTAAYQEPAAAPHAEVVTPGDRGHDEAPRSWSERC